MKKIFTTLLSLFYLVSGIGFGNMHFNCLNNQKIMSSDEHNCCCNMNSAEMSEINRIAEKPDANSCCVMNESGKLMDDCDTKLPGDCCEIQYDYNQLENSSLPQNNEINYVAELSSEHYFYPQNPHKIDRSVTAKFTNQPKQVNLTLLI